MDERAMINIKLTYFGKLVNVRYKVEGILSVIFLKEK